MILEAITLLTQGKDLSRELAGGAMAQLMRGQGTPAQIGAFLAALRVKGETVDEITGFAETMRSLATRIECQRRPLVDTCGTGGDRSGTFNISTAAAFVTAGADVAVAKHGNRSATSQCGSADVLEELGVNVDATPEVIGRSIDSIGIGFLFARALHGAMKHVAPIRQELGVRTVFNILGPLTNPANADGQILGVFDSALVEPLAHVLANLGVRHVFVVAGSDGLDEITITGSSIIAEARDGHVKTYELSPEEVGIPLADRASITGGDAQTNAAILRRVLEGEAGPRRDIVVLNAAAAIQAGSQAGDWREGIDKAETAIDSGAALAKLEALMKASHDS